jgi:hypothetical protein
MKREEWITKVEAGRRLGIDPGAFTRMVDNGLVTRKRLPFARELYSASDVAAIAAAAIVPREDGKPKRTTRRAGTRRAVRASA